MPRRSKLLNSRFTWPVVGGTAALIGALFVFSTFSQAGMFSRAGTPVAPGMPGQVGSMLGGQNSPGLTPALPDKTYTVTVIPPEPGRTLYNPKNPTEYSQVYLDGERCSTNPCKSDPIPVGHTVGLFASPGDHDIWGESWGSDCGPKVIGAPVLKSSLINLVVGDNYSCVPKFITPTYKVTISAVSRGLTGISRGGVEYSINGDTTGGANDQDSVVVLKVQRASILKLNPRPKAQFSGIWFFKGWDESSSADCAAGEIKVLHDMRCIAMFDINVGAALGDLFHSVLNTTVLGN